MTEQIIQNNHFTLKRVRPIVEMQGRLWEMEHEKSGAKLVWLERPDENMTFAISFRTIPTDSTGVFHILEHSVLNGSDQYPVKEPFVELLKSSLQTFLNAMTFPDKTVYPVSSRNRQDFMNLMHVYMDAVLHPMAVKNPNIFRQEGWRVEQPDDPIFQGVVYNEMKGAYSDVRSLIERAMMEHLFPDTCYRHSSGGDPAKIPTLTYEQFVREHAKYYHPSNAQIVLDGDIDLDECLGFLDECLRPYQRQELVFPIAVQQPLAYREQVIPYEIGVGEDAAGKTIVSYGKLLCGFDSPLELCAARVLADYLAGGSEGPLMRAILDAGLGADVNVELNDGMQQAWFGWQVWNTEADKLPQIKQVIRSTLEQQLEQGLDRQRLLGCYNSLAFKLMDRDNYGYPRGLAEALTILDSWLYNGDPAQNLAYRQMLDELKEKLFSGYLEDLLRRCLLDEREGFLAVFVPSETLGQERVQQEQQRVAAYWGGLSEAEKQSLRTQLDALHVWQQTPDSAEALATIPMLSLKDIQGDPKPLECRAEVSGGVNVLCHRTDSELMYMDLHFEASDVTPEQTPLLTLLCSLLGMLGTKKHTGSQLQTEVRQKIGTLEFTPEVFHQDAAHHRTVFTVRSVSLPAFKQEAAALLAEILTATEFTDSDTIRSILRQEKNECQQKLIAMGNRFAASRVLARQTSAGAAKELLSGCSYIRWLGSHCDLSDQEMAGLQAELSALCRKLFTQARLTVSVCENAADQVGFFAAAFPAGEQAAESASFPLLPACREGVLIPGGVGYAAKGINLEHLGKKFSGQMYVLSNLLTFEHLWNAVRVQGGAYGTGFRGDSSNDLLATSFRDPSPCKSLSAFDACADVVEGFQGDVTKYILGAMSDADPLLCAADKIHLAEMRHFRGITHEDTVQRHRELLSCTAQDLAALCGSLRAMAREQNYCIVGGKEQLDSQMLDEIIQVLN